MDEDTQADVIIAGGGSAGCVLAARLSEDPGMRVLLLEAGPDISAATIPDELKSSYPGKAYADATYHWPGLKAALASAGANDPEARAAPYEQARVLGGGSTINGVGANRGAPEDYDEWAGMGLVGWGWADVFPYFRKLERDLDFANEWHGDSGPIPVTRHGERIWTPFTRTMLGVTEERGIPFLPDQNAAWQDGTFEMAVNVDEAGNRISCATGYLTDAVRARENLEVRTGVTVARVLLEDGAAVGVEVDGPGGPRRLRGGEVVVASGALSSPALLMRSGIGPAPHLAECAIAVERDLPGVGQNLMEHPSAGLVAFLRPRARQPAAPFYHIPIGMRFSSGVEGCPAGDMHMNFITRAAWHAVGRQLAPVFFWINKSHSRGQLLLDANAPEATPRIDFRLLSDPRDLARLADAFELAVSLLEEPAARTVVEDFFPASRAGQDRKYGAPTARNALATAVIARTLDLSAALRRRVLPRVLAGDHDARVLAADRDALEDYLLANVGGVWHPSGTCRMGPDGDRLAVTDGAGRVRGVPRLRVCDASLMPTIPCANTNVPVIMMAEKIADTMRAERREAVTAAA